MIPNFVWRYIGRKIAQSLNLEDTMVTGKPWYQSKTIWANVGSGLIGIYLALVAGGAPHLPPIPPWLVTILSGIGIYGRATASAKITTTSSVRSA